jgi:hypothetical protein
MKIGSQKQDPYIEFVGFEVLTAVLGTCFHACFLLGLFIDREDGGDVFLRNVG